MIFIEIPESSSPERWIRLARPCESRVEADRLAGKVLGHGRFYRVVSEDVVATTLCTAYATTPVAS